MKLTEVTSYNSKSAQILNEGWQELTESQRIFLSKAERELWPLMEELTRVFEASLSPKQIQAIFQNAEEVAMAGDNRTGIAKAGAAAKSAVKLPVDVMKKVNAKVNELGKMAQNTGPVRNLDQKIEKLKGEIGEQDSKIVQGIKAVSDWAKANPGKASLAVAILTAAAAFATGPGGGAAVGFLLRSTKGMLQGEQLSTAVGKAAKTAAVGALAGMALDNLGDGVLDNVAAAQEAEVEGMIQDFKDANIEMAMNNIDPELAALFPELEGAARYSMTGSINNFFYNYDIVFTDDMLQEYNALQAEVDATKTFSDEFYKKSVALHDWLAGVQNDPMQEQYKSALEALNAAQEAEELSSQQWDNVLDVEDALTDKLNALSQLDDGVAAAAQAGAQAAVDDKKKAIKVSKPEQGELDLKGGGMAQPVDKDFDRSQKLSDFGPVGSKAESLSMEEKFDLWLMEADPAQGELGLDNPNTFGAKLKRGAGKLASKAKAGAQSAAGAVKTKAQAVGKELGNKVTVAKLMKAWKNAGEPTDTGSIYNILSGAGMNDDQIGQIGMNQKVNISPSADAQDNAQNEPNAQDNVQNPAQADANKDGKDDATGKPIQKTTPTQQVDLKSLADEIKKAGVADQVKQMLASNQAAPAANKNPAFDKTQFRARADRARAMKPKKIRSDIYTDIETENTDA